MGYSFLLLKYIESGKKRADYFETLGRELAAMHKADTESFLIQADSETDGKNRFGFFQDNFIGARPQDNTPTADWISFFRESRLLPQFKAADRYFSDSDRSQNTKLLDNLEKFLTEPEKPSLLHGDLWGGNVLAETARRF